MGKQADGYNKVEDNPCAELAKASLKCKYGVLIEPQQATP